MPPGPAQFKRRRTPDKPCCVFKVARACVTSWSTPGALAGQPLRSSAVEMGSFAFFLSFFLSLSGCS
eukprot:15459824-Alexandrium_andersonii.AAC.1